MSDSSIFNLNSDDNFHKPNTDNISDLSILDEIRTKNINRLIIGNLNINSLSSKFEQLKVLLYTRKS